ncbi:MAG: hypothetical protein ACU84Q_17505 [Gammaproteobacteria bacterium]
MSKAIFIQFGQDILTTNQYEKTVSIVRLIIITKSLADASIMPVLQSAVNPQVKVAVEALGNLQIQWLTETIEMGRKSKTLAVIN